MLCSYFPVLMQCVCCNRPEGHNKVGKTSSFRSGPGPCSYKNIGPSRQPAPLLLSCRKPGRRSRAPSIHLLLLLLTSSPAENLGRDGGERVVRAVLRVSPAPPWSWPRGRISSSSSTTSSWAKNRWAKRFLLRHVTEECRFLKWSSVSLHVGLMKNAKTNTFFFSFK